MFVPLPSVVWTQVFFSDKINCRNCLLGMNFLFKFYKKFEPMINIDEGKKNSSRAKLTWNTFFLLTSISFSNEKTNKQSSTDNSHNWCTDGTEQNQIPVQNCRAFILCSFYSDTDFIHPSELLSFVHWVWDS